MDQVVDQQTLQCRLHFKRLVAIDTGRNLKRGFYFGCNSELSIFQQLFSFYENECDGLAKIKDLMDKYVQIHPENETISATWLLQKFKHHYEDHININGGQLLLKDRCGKILKEFLQVLHQEFRFRSVINVE